MVKAKATPTKSRSPFYGVLAILAVAGGAGIWYAIQSKPKPIVLDNTLVASLPKAEGYLRGNPDAPVTIMEFADFECPVCAQFATLEEPEVMTKLVNTGLVNFRFFDFPMAMHPNTLSAHLAASCAADQGKFWEMHDALFANQDRWNGKVTSNPRKFIDPLAAEVGVDAQKYATCMTSQANLARIQAGMKAGNERGVGGTPTIFVGNQQVRRNAYDAIKTLVDSIVAANPKAAAPAMAAPAAK